MLEMILQVVVDTKSHAFAALHTGIAIEIVLVSAHIWYIASIIRALFLCSTWIFTLFCKQSAHVTKGRLEYCLWVNVFCLAGRLLPISNPEFKSHLNFSSNSYWVLELALFFVLRFSYYLKKKDNSWKTCFVCHI